MGGTYARGNPTPVGAIHESPTQASLVQREVARRSRDGGIVIVGDTLCAVPPPSVGAIPESPAKPPLEGRWFAVGEPEG